MAPSVKSQLELIQESLNTAQSDLDNMGRS